MPADTGYVLFAFQLMSQSTLTVLVLLFLFLFMGKPTWNSGFSSMKQLNKIIIQNSSIWIYVLLPPEW